MEGDHAIHFEGCTLRLSNASCETKCKNASTTRVGGPTIWVRSVIRTKLQKGFNFTNAKLRNARVSYKLNVELLSMLTFNKRPVLDTILAPLIFSSTDFSRNWENRGILLGRIARHIGIVSALALFVVSFMCAGAIASCELPNLSHSFSVDDMGGGIKNVARRQASISAYHFYDFFNVQTPEMQPTRRWCNEFEIVRNICSECLIVRAHQRWPLPVEQNAEHKIQDWRCNLDPKTEMK